MTEWLWVLVGLLGFIIGWLIPARQINWEAIRKDIEKGEILG